ncbi:alpha/beta fold hydrolase [Gordonia sp. OPL2]|uniref:alpha/beta fold hydrolase n=1 Tax=Gordonia sp. OPL2 TaxID=2486274 RepID=UPI001656813F|nr:alpha/beta hydrolase [Gordonia sp. OPL2]ROZ86491.1 alpha/beta hydrolase [Gordonia sp. OPL2]
MPTSTTPPDEIDFTGVGGITSRADEWRPPSDDTGSVGSSATDTDGPTGPTILLLHGGGQTRHSWKKTGHLLADAGARVFSLDTRGHGRSDWSPDGHYSLDLFTADVVEVVRQIGRPVTLVGASMGGLSSIGAAATLGPDIVEALVLVDVVPRFDQQGSARIRDFMTGNVDGFDTLHDAADAISSYLPHRDKIFNPEGLKRNLRQGDDGRWYWHWDPAFVRSKPGDDRFVRAEHLEEQLASLSVPILLIRGKLSDVVPADAVEGFRAVVPKAEVVELSDAAHTAAADDNDAFTGVVLDFIRARR